LDAGLPERIADFSLSCGMEVRSTTEQEALAQMSTKSGTDAEQLVKDPPGGALAEMRRLRARIKADPEGWTARDYVHDGGHR
jgi:hypothetical protein